VRFRVEANQDNRGVGPPLRWTFDGTALSFRMERCPFDDRFFCDFLEAHYTSRPWEKVG
jgi:hypothetical protein